MRISDWSSDVCSSDLLEERHIDAFTRQDLALEVRAAGELLEWQLEDLGDFAVVDMQLRLNVDDADHRRDAVTAQCRIVIQITDDFDGQIGRASCRERVCQYV